jgi:O-antigen ligase
MHSSNAARRWDAWPARGQPAVATTADRAWDGLLVCVAIYIFAAVGRVHQLFPALELLRPAILSGGIAILLFAFDRRPERRLAPLFITPTRVLIAFCGWMVLSVPTALVGSTSFDLVVNNFLKTFVMFFVIAGAIRGPRDLERLLWIYFLSATIYAAVTITRFDGGADGWRLGKLYYYDANDFATFALTAVPFGLYGLVTARTALSRGFAAAGLLLLTLAFLRTGSRGGFVALLIMGGYLLFRFTAVRLRWRMAAAGAIVVVGLAAASAEYWARMSTILSDDDYNRTDESGRMQIWQRGIGYMLSYPVFGVGPNNFGTAEGTLSPLAKRQQFGVGVRWNAPHNSFVQVAAELGVVGIALFIALFVTAFKALRVAGWRRRTPRGEPALLSQTLTASLLGFAGGAFFLTLAYSEMLYALLAFSVAWHKVASCRPRPRPLPVAA